MLNDQVAADIQVLLDAVPELDHGTYKPTYFEGTPAIAVTIYSRISRGQLGVLSKGISALPAYVEMTMLRERNFITLYFW